MCWTTPWVIYLSDIFLSVLSRQASGYLFSFGANRLNYWWWKLHGWGNALPWLHGSFGDGLKLKLSHAETPQQQQQQQQHHRMRDLWSWNEEPLCNYSNFTTEWRCNMWPAAGWLVAAKLLFKQPPGGTINALSARIVCCCSSAFRAACILTIMSGKMQSKSEDSPLPDVFRRGGTSSA